MAISRNTSTSCYRRILEAEVTLTLYRHGYTATHDYAAQSEAVYPALISQKIMSKNPMSAAHFCPSNDFGAIPARLVPNSLPAPIGGGRS